MQKIKKDDLVKVIAGKDKDLSLIHILFSFQTLSQFRFLCNNSLNSSDILANLFDSAGII